MSHYPHIVPPAHRVIVLLLCPHINMHTIIISVFC